MDRKTALGYSSAFASAVCYGISWVLIRKGVTDVAPPLVGVTLSMLVGVVALSGIEFKRMATGGLQWNKPLLFLALSGLLYGVAHLSSFVALTLAPVAVVVPLTSTSTLITVAAARVFLRRMEHVSMRMVVGGVLVVAGAILVSLGRA